MVKLIKFAFRRNLIYPLQLLLWNFLRDIESALINYFYNVNGFSIYTSLMFLGEFLAGLIFYLYLRYNKKGNRKGKNEQLMNIKFIYNKENFAKRMDIKVFILILTISLSDFAQFTIFFALPKFMTISTSLEQRLRGNFTINNALFFYYILKLPLYKHHIFSLLLIGTCILIIIISEFFFQEFDIFLSYTQFIYALLIMFFIQSGYAF